MFQLILEESIGKSSISANVTTFNAVPVKSAFFKLVFALKEQAKMGRLVKKIKKWFDDNNEPKSFRYRFTGLESRLFLKNFMFLIDALKQPHDSARQTFRLHIFAYLCLMLRQCVSIFCRVIHVTYQDIADLKKHCLNFFRAQCLFNRVTPTTWTIGHIVPNHALQVFQKYHLGLNVVSMEGREAKHIAVKRYSQNTNYHGRWIQIFRHEFVHLIWLREKGFEVGETYKRKEVYVPESATNGESCFCGFPKLVEDKCSYCSHPFSLKN